MKPGGEFDQQEGETTQDWVERLQKPIDYGFNTPEREAHFEFWEKAMAKLKKEKESS
jgi:hypothetical protein